MERLDPGHRHHLQEHPRQTCPGQGLNPRPPAPHHSSKALLEQLYKPFGTSTQPIIAVSLATSTV
jgi:hypothetical protein